MLGGNELEDVRWLCSLSESELDLLVSIKEMAIHRACSIGHQSLANKFDLKMLRGVSFVLMAKAFPSRVNQEISEEFREMGVEELMGYIASDRKKRLLSAAADDDDDLVSGKKKRVGMSM